MFYVHITIRYIVQYFILRAINPKDIGYTEIVKL